jgi:prophage regulatory protein
MKPERPRRILRLPAVRDRTGLTTTTIYRGAREGWFPKPVKLCEGGSASGWFEHEVEAYLDRIAAEREGASVAPTTSGPRLSSVT